MGITSSTAARCWWGKRNSTLTSYSLTQLVFSALAFSQWLVMAKVQVLCQARMCYKIGEMCSFFCSITKLWSTKVGLKSLMLIKCFFPHSICYFNIFRVSLNLFSSHVMYSTTCQTGTLLLCYVSRRWR